MVLCWESSWSILDHPCKMNSSQPEYCSLPKGEQTADSCLVIAVKVLFYRKDTFNQEKHYFKSKFVKMGLLTRSLRPPWTSFYFPLPVDYLCYVRIFYLSRTCNPLRNLDAHGNFEVISHECLFKITHLISFQSEGKNLSLFFSCL